MNSERDTKMELPQSILKNGSNATAWVYFPKGLKPEGFALFQRGVSP